MKRLILALLASMGASHACSAAWQTGTFTDKMTDRKESYARLNSVDGTASLYVGCMNGRILPQIEFQRRIANGDIGVTYRFDEGPVVPRITPVSTDGTSLWLWISSGPETSLKIRH
jgi:hypothetical protein